MFVCFLKGLCVFVFSGVCVCLFSQGCVCVFVFSGVCVFVCFLKGVCVFVFSGVCVWFHLIVLPRCFPSSTIRCRSDSWQDLRVEVCRQHSIDFIQRFCRTT